MATELDPVEAGHLTTTTAVQVARLKAHFLRFDPQGTGAVLLGDLDGVLRSLGCTLSKQHRNQLMETVKLSGTDERTPIGFEDFLRVWVESDKIQKAGMSFDKQLRLAFSTLDKAGSGAIGEDQFRALLHMADVQLRGDMVDELMRELDVTGGGKITYSDLKRVLLPLK